MIPFPLAYDYTDEKRRYFAQRFALWMGIASMTMVFAGFTSAYIVKKADTTSWHNFPLPVVFYLSTAIIVLSSITMALAVRNFRREKLRAYRNLLGLTLMLGSAFVGCQIAGWMQLSAQGVFINENVAGAFLYVISGTHAVHVLGGIVLLLISWLAVTRKMRNPVYDLTMAIKPQRKLKVEMVATYWHFVDVLWLYLFIFLVVNHLEI